MFSAYLSGPWRSNAATAANRELIFIPLATKSLYFTGFFENEKKKKILFLLGGAQLSHLNRNAPTFLLIGSK
jgi:hypothetical protein